MPIPNDAMVAEAQRGLDWRSEYGRGGTEIGVARARDIVNKRDLSMDTVRRMVSFFARHAGNKDAEGYRPGEDGYPSNGRIAHALWGGDAGMRWANRLAEQEQKGRGMADIQMRATGKVVEYRAEPDELSVGDFVTWDSSGGEAYGKIRRIVRDGQISVPNTDFTINGTEDDPAALIMLYREGEEGWSPSGTLVGHRFSTMSKVSERYKKDKDEKRHIKRITESDTEITIVFHKDHDMTGDEMLGMDMDDERVIRSSEGKELRSGVSVEVREAPNGQIKVSGYAAVFDEDADIGGMFRETIAPGAFRDAVDRDDVVFLVNHAGLPLARTRSGTLRLSEDVRGLYMEANLDLTDPDVRAIVPKMKRGDLDKMSFGFIAERQEWSDMDSKYPKRTIQRVKLFDVSVVTTPAYDGTDIALRSLSAHRAGVSQAKRRLRMKSRIV